MWNILHVKFVCVTLYGHETCFWFLYLATENFSWGLLALGMNMGLHWEPYSSWHGAPYWHGVLGIGTRFFETFVIFVSFFWGLGSKQCRPFRERLEDELCSKCWDHLDLRWSNNSLAGRAITQVVRLSPLRSGFCSRPVHVDRVVDGVAVGRVFVRVHVFRISCVSIVPLMLHTHSFVTNTFLSNSLKHPLRISFHIPSVS